MGAGCFENWRFFSLASGYFDVRGELFFFSFGVFIAPTAFWYTLYCYVWCSLVGWGISSDWTSLPVDLFKSDLLWLDGNARGCDLFWLDGNARRCGLIWWDESPRRSGFIWSDWMKLPVDLIGWNPRWNKMTQQRDHRVVLAVHRLCRRGPHELLGDEVDHRIRGGDAADVHDVRWRRAPYSDHRGLAEVRRMSQEEKRDVVYT